MDDGTNSATANVTFSDDVAIGDWGGLRIWIAQGAPLWPASAFAQIASNVIAFQDTSGNQSPTIPPGVAWLVNGAPADEEQLQSGLTT